MLGLSNCLVRSAIALRRVRKLSRVPLGVFRSPWAWPVGPLVSIALIGQWRGVVAAEAIAAICAAIAIGVAIRLMVAGRRAVVPRSPVAAGVLVQADLRGADLTAADLTDAQLGPLDEEPGN